MNVKLTASCEELCEQFFALNSPEDVAEILNITYQQLNYYRKQWELEKHYTTFTIAKKSRTNAVRLISAPVTPLKIIQIKLNQVLQCVYECKVPKVTAHGFRPEHSIVTNALSHLGKRYVLNIDLQDFFPSISFRRVRGMLMAWPYNRPYDVAMVLAQLCCFRDELPQGAPTSPIISNMICAKMDTGLRYLAMDTNCKYTRYADDITFSTHSRNFPAELARQEEVQVTVGSELTRIIEDNGFQINPNKVRLMVRYQRQEVTGLTVNERPNVRRTYIRQIRAMLHAWKKHGLERAEKVFQERYSGKHRHPNSSPPAFKEVLRGKIAFVGLVKGKDDIVYNRLKRKFRELDAPEIFEDRTRSIFLNYASEDRERVIKIYNRLKREGYEPWMDKQGIHGGRRWENVIKKELDKAALFIACLSRTSVVKRGYVQKEIKLALEKQYEKLHDDIYIIPFRLDECKIPSNLEEFHCLDYFSEDGWDNLIRAVNRGLSQLDA